MPEKRKASSQKKPVPRKKVKQDGNAATAPSHMETTQQQSAQDAANATPGAMGTPTTVPEGEGATIPTSVTKQATQDTNTAALTVAESASTVQQESEDTAQVANSSEIVILDTSGALEKKTCFIANLDTDTLIRIFYEAILRVPPNSTPGQFGTPWHFNGFKHPVIYCATRATLRSVCKQWADLISDAINLWRDIHIDGQRIPSPAKWWWKGWRPDPQNYSDLDPNEAQFLLPVVDIVGEMPRASFSVKRSQESTINLVLVDPTYDPMPRLTDFGRPFLPRPGILEFLHGAMDEPMIGSLSISTEDIHFVKDLFDPGVYLDGRCVVERKMETWTVAELISLACDGEEADHFDLSTLPPSTAETFNGIRTRTQRRTEETNEIEHARLRKKFKVWPKLHTLRIRTRDPGWMLDQQRCALPADRAPALRHLELELFHEHPLWLWTFPYSQLTHLTLATEESSDFLLGIIARCTSLESLIITLRTWTRDDTESTLTVDSGNVLLSFLRRLSIQIDAPRTSDHKFGRRFLDSINTPRLQSLEVISRNVNRAYPILHLLKRSQCQLLDLRLDFSSSVLDARRGRVPKPERFNLQELFYFVSPTVENFAIQSGLMNCSWFEDSSAPNLQNITMLCFGIEEEFLRYKYIDDNAQKVALHVLRWAEKWMKGASEEEKRKRSIEFVAGPASVAETDGTDVFYGNAVSGKCDQVSCPDTINVLVSRIRAMGGKIEVLWTTARELTEEDIEDYFEQKKDEPRSTRRDTMRW
ncbi:hypothetical protein DFP72DRAFT_856645 [Ephemerocybe angulata]|uniref:F-box domain-containing protein n=1 Tax=Ephemerocybe angulata TaxID=980116 RepID=A0A8H6HE81_9AGAR|nr:hypothetical protein DFP72DRAFT_856645 [Tulosesus angulatus]